MNTVGQIRRANLEALVVEFTTLDAVAALAETSSVYLSQIRNMTVDVKTGRPREMGSKMARRMETACAKPEGWMDAPHEPVASAHAEDVEALDMENWLLHASPRSREVIDQLRLLAQKNALGDDDWEMIRQLAQRFQQKKS